MAISSMKEVEEGSEDMLSEKVFRKVVNSQDIGYGEEGHTGR